MNKRFTPYLLLLSLFKTGGVFANLSEAGTNFGSNLLQRQQSSFTDNETNEKLQNLPKFKSYQNGGSNKEEGEQATMVKELQGTFSANVDRGLKNDDPIKNDLSKMNARQENANHSTNPNLSQTEELLKQKHRWHIHENDPILSNTYTVNPKEKIEREGEFKQKKEAEDNINSFDKIVTCRESIHPITIHCTKRLVLKPVPQNKVVKEVNVSYSRGNQHYFGRDSEVSINLKTGGVSFSGFNINPSVSVSPILGNVDNPEQAVVELKAASHGENYHSLFYLSQAPSHANGFIAKFKDLGRWFWFWHNVTANYTWKITIQPKPQLEEHWEGCELEEKRVKENYCRLMSQEAKEKNENKKIEGYPDLVTRDFWLETRTYLCGLGTGVSECQKWQKQGCEQIGSRCLKYEKDHCIEFEQTYRCSRSNVRKESNVAIPEHIAIDSKDTKEKSEAFDSADFGEAITGFSALTEMSKNLNGLGGIGGSSNNPSVFNGECQRCSIKLGSAFQNCCNLSGIALGLFGGCREGEKKLAVAAVKDKRCHKVQDKYCTKRILRQCVEKKEAYCCYGSQIAKIIQEIAHYQLNIPWGSGDNPNCGSLTAEQLSRLDFDTPFAREKLSALIGELQSSAEVRLSKTQENIQGQSNINSRLESLQKSLKNHFSKDRPQRLEGRKP